MLISCSVCKSFLLIVWRYRKIFEGRLLASLFLSVRIEEFASHRTDFHEIRCLSIFRKYVKKVKVLLTLRLLMSYIYGAPILDVSRSHITTQHSR